MLSRRTGHIGGRTSTSVAVLSGKIARGSRRGFRLIPSQPEVPRFSHQAAAKVSCDSGIDEIPLIDCSIHPRRHGPDCEPATSASGNRTRRMAPAASSDLESIRAARGHKKKKDTEGGEAPHPTQKSRRGRSGSGLSRTTASSCGGNWGRRSLFPQKPISGDQTVGSTRGNGTPLARQDLGFVITRTQSHALTVDSSIAESMIIGFMLFAAR